MVSKEKEALPSNILQNHFAKISILTLRCFSQIIVRNVCLPTRFSEEPKKIRIQGAHKVNFKEDSISLVIAGKWNVKIFTPAWVAENIFKCKDIQVEFSINTFDAPVRLTHNSVRFIPSNERVIFYPQKRDVETFSRVEEMAKVLCETLKHTPINAYGINFDVFEQEPDSSLLERFNFKDAVSFSDAGISIKSKEVIRSADIADGTLNFRTSLDDGKVGFYFNFHYAVTSAISVAENVIGKFTQCKSIVEQITSDIYNNPIETEEE